MTRQVEAFFIAGETSADRNAAPVVAELRAHGLRVTGVGGPQMAAAGAELLAESTGWGAVGVPESLRRLPLLLARSRWLRREILRRQPAVVVLVDFGLFNVRMARYLRGRGDVRIFYYFPPGSWRQTPRDWSDLARWTDCIATPFRANARFLQQSGANAHWVGHPAVDFLQSVGDRRAVRGALGLPQGEPVIGLLPGSRRMEREILGPLMLTAARRLTDALPDAQFLWSSLPGTERTDARFLGAVPPGLVTPVGQSHDILRASDLVLVAMGTVTLEAAAACTPMVTTYDGSLIAKWLALYVLRQSQRFYAMPNLLMGREVVPEVVPHRAAQRVTAEALAEAVLAVWNDEDRLQRMRHDLAQVRRELGEPGVSQRTAQLILQLVGLA